MAEHLYLVFSQPPDGLPDAEYQRWYHDHVIENIEVPGFHGVQRFRVDPVVPGGVPATHLAAYEYDGDILALRTALDARRERGEIVLPEWFDRIRFQTWDCAALEPRIDAPAR